MGLFDLFKSPPYQDPVLGPLIRGGGRWKGSLTLPGVGVVPLLLSGTRARPDEGSLLLARSVPEKYAGMREEIQKHLFDHYEPYKEAVEADELDASSFPTLQAPAEVWPHTEVERVLIEPLDGVLTVEIAYRVAWDEEHTPGAWIRDWRVFEFCGSVGP
jgi:hypothetical protein